MRIKLAAGVTATPRAIFATVANLLEAQGIMDTSYFRIDTHGDADFILTSVAGKLTAEQVTRKEALS